MNQNYKEYTAYGDYFNETILDILKQMAVNNHRDINYIHIDNSSEMYSYIITVLVKIEE